MSDVLPKRGVVGQIKPAIRVAPLVLEVAALDVANVYGRLATRAQGLTSAAAAVRLSEHGPNVLARDRRPGAAATTLDLRSLEGRCRARHL
jgi:cation transport ATPase-like protein